MEQKTKTRTCRCGHPRANHAQEQHTCLAKTDGQDCLCDKYREEHASGPALPASELWAAPPIRCRGCGFSAFGAFGPALTPDYALARGWSHSAEGWLCHKCVGGTDLVAKPATHVTMSKQDAELVRDQAKALIEAEQTITTMQDVINDRDKQIAGLVSRLADSQQGTKTAQATILMRDRAIQDQRGINSGKQQQIRRLTTELAEAKEGALELGRRLARSEEDYARICEEWKAADDEIRKGDEEGDCEQCERFGKIIRQLHERLGEKNCLHGEEEIHETTLCLDRASELVCGDRARDYGDPVQGYARLAAAWSAYLGFKKLDGRDVICMLGLMKLFRDRVRRKTDNAVDLAGYAQLMAWVGDPRKTS